MAGGILMNKFGFQLRSLKLVGDNVEDAEIRFTSGLNLISGPSNTGKTFIFDCVDYMLGKGNIPTAIEESKKYNKALLEIEVLSSNEIYTLERSIIKNNHFNIFCKQNLLGKYKKENDNDNENNISFFLLNFFNLVNKKVKTNKRNKKRTLTFRDIKRLFMVSEEDIIKKGSPIFSGHRTSATAEQSVFSLLLSGIDDTLLIASEDPKISKAKNTAKIEFAKEIISQLESEISKESKQLEFDKLKDKLSSHSEDNNRLNENLKQLQDKATLREQERSEYWTEIRSIDSRKNVLSELNKRFKLLEEQYISDLKRLDAISEASAILDQVQPSKCSICGASAEYHDNDCQDANTECVKKSCDIEKNKIKLLQKKLEETRQDIDLEIEKLSEKYTCNAAILKEINLDIEKNLKPQISNIINEINLNFEQKENLKLDISNSQKIQEYSQLIESLSKTKVVSKEALGSDNKLDDELKKLCDSVERTLDGWKCFSKNKISFNDDNKVWDIVISGKERKSDGKGFRAITHSAFNLGLFKYCILNNMPHPGFIILDSPLTVYDEPEEKKKLETQNIDKLFYESIVREFGQQQVIIFENEKLPETFNNDYPINYIRFTRLENNGRYGFIPI
ncbi:hypothetical protein AAEX28_15790 [Lentisphaerota bacterium WC36G]|nr:hypothetical protein LJT99_02555 [Lentisphaerae bacterium WC36]